MVQLVLVIVQVCVSILVVNTCSFSAFGKDQLW